MMFSQKCFFSTILCCSLVAATLSYAGDQRPASMKNGGWAVKLDTGYQHQFDTNIDDGGAFSVDRIGVRAGFDYYRSEKQAFSLSLNYGHHDYDFSGSKGMGALKPWDEIHDLSVSAPMRWSFNDKWSMILIPTLGSAVEDGAELNDGFYAAATTMFVYKVSDCLKIGPGIAAKTEIEDGASVFPLLYIDWQITDKFNLKTGPAQYVFGAPGVTLGYDLNKKTELFFSAGMERLRFRLDNNGVAKKGVGEETAIPLTLGACYNVNRNASICVNGGVKVGGEVTLEDRDGDKISEKDIDPAGFLGFSLKIRF